MAIRDSARSRRLRPSMGATPYSVTTKWTSARVSTTPAPCASTGTIRERDPSAVVDGRAMMGRPPSASAAPRMKSAWPPKPLWILSPIESEQTWPVRSISMALLTAVIPTLRAMFAGWFT